MLAAAWSYVPYFGSSSEAILEIPDSDIPMEALTKKTEEVRFECLEEPVRTEVKPWEKEVAPLDPKDILRQLVNQIKAKPGLAESVLADNESDCPETLKALLTEDTEKVFEHFDKKEKMGLGWVIVDNYGEPESTSEIELKPAEESKWPAYVTVPATVITTAGKVTYVAYVEVARLTTLIGVGAIALQSPWLPILKFVLGRVIK